MRPAHRISLIVYTAVLVYSGVLAVYYLVIYRPTRLAFGRSTRLEFAGRS